METLHFVIVDKIHIIRRSLIESVVGEISPEITPGLPRSQQHRCHHGSIAYHQLDQGIRMIDVRDGVDNEEIIALILLAFTTEEQSDTISFLTSMKH